MLVYVGDIVIHIMKTAIRTYYNLEEVWGGKPVRLKLSPDSTRPAVASSQTAFDPMGTRDEPEGRRGASRSSRPARSNR